MEENIANRRWISTRTEDHRQCIREIEELLIHIVKTTGGGGRLHFELVDRIVQHLTSRNLSTLVDNADAEVHVLEYIKSCLPAESPLIVSLADESLSLRYEESTLDCSAELEDSLAQVKNKIKTSWNITVLDLSRRCFSSKTELLEVCESAKMVKRLILRDIQIQSCDEESLTHFPLIERITWYCPALEEVDITGCSPSVLGELFQTERSPYESTSGVHVIDLLSNKPEAKELLMPSRITSDVPDVACRIKKLVQEGVPANISYDGWSLLHTASVIGDVDLVTWLLEKSDSRKFHVASSNRRTPLEMAIHCHNAPIVKQLLDKTDSVDPAKLVDLCFLSQLMSKEPGVTHPNHSNDCDPMQVFQVFIDRSSLEYKSSLLVEVSKVIQKIPPRELNEKTCWTEESISEMFKALVSSEFSPDIPIKDLGGKTPLMCAISSPALVKTLLNLGANSHASDEEGNTALFYAVAGATVETADDHFQSSKILLEYSADANFKNKYGQTPLLYDASSAEKLSQGCNLQIWKLLVESGAEIAALDKERKSLMHLVVDRTKKYLEQLTNSNQVEEISNLSQRVVVHCIEQIKFVSKHNDKLVRSRDSMGNTPLHLLAEHNSPCTDDMLAIANALIEVGSNVKVTNDHGKTPLHLAKTWSMAKFLLEQGAKPNASDDMGCTPLLCRAKAANLERMPALTKWTEGVNLGMDLWKEDSEGQNVFHVLMESGNFEDVKPFIDASVNHDREAIFRTDSKGNSLLHYLCNYNDSRVLPLVDFVLRSGANVNAQNTNGDTALHNACRSIVRLPKQKGQNSVQWRVIPKLLSYKARCNVRNNKGATVKDIAWLYKKLLTALNREVTHLEPPSIYPWIQQSQSHRILLSAAARGQNCQKIGNYCYYDQPIGSGAFSNVYAAIDIQDGREVALKRTDTYRLKTRQDDREVSTLLQLASCPQIVNYISFYRDTGFTWIALELMEGTLNDLLVQEIYQDSLPKLCKDFMLGVQYLHKNKILHRDLKPNNVLYTCEPCLKIADFGLSKKLGTGQGSSVFQTNAGTKVWMAPELLLSPGHLQHTFASDMFACGLLIHYMLADRRHPFEGNTCATDGYRSIADWNEVEQNITTGNKTLSPDLSDEAKYLIAHVLSLESKDRPTASEVLKHPLFWSSERKIRFVCAVANQSEVGTFGGRGTVASPVELEIENNLASMFHPTWDALFPAVYAEMTSSARGRRYDTSSGVHLVRFIRNAYAHVSDRARPTGFQKDLLKEWIFLKELPNLFMVVFKAVKRGNWHTSREEIASVVDSED